MRQRPLILTKATCQGGTRSGCSEAGVTPVCPGAPQHRDPQEPRHRGAASTKCFGSRGPPAPGPELAPGPCLPGGAGRAARRAHGRAAAARLPPAHAEGSLCADPSSAPRGHEHVLGPGPLPSGPRTAGAGRTPGFLPEAPPPARPARGSRAAFPGHEGLNPGAGTRWLSLPNAFSSPFPPRRPGRSRPPPPPRRSLGRCGPPGVRRPVNPSAAGASRTGAPGKWVTRTRPAPGQRPPGAGRGGPGAGRSRSARPRRPGGAAGERPRPVPSGTRGGGRRRTARQRRRTKGEAPPPRARSPPEADGLPRAGPAPATAPAGNLAFM